MRQGNYEEGWKNHEYRLPEAGRFWRAGVPPWQGEALDGNHVVVWCEQGLGDTIQFARFVSMLRQAARVTFCVPRRLVRLLTEQDMVAELRPTEEGLVSADYQTKVMSLPHYLAIGRNIALAPCPYLRSNALLREQWARLLPRGFKVALSWQGNPNYAADGSRSMPFHYLEALLADTRRDVTFLSLQKNFGYEQLKRSSMAPRILDLGNQIDCGDDAFLDSLAILSLVDLFITTDTALAHLAGAAGVRTWLLLSAAPDWRWGLDGEQTCWYPNTRLLRQRHFGDWSELVRRLRNELAQVVSEATADALS
jgi:hypothetical protein